MRLPGFIHHQWKAVFSLFFLLCLLSACNQEKDIRDYYFPVKKLTDGLVYVYEPLDSPDTSLIYWHLLATEKEDNFYLNTTVYGRDFTPTNLNTEKITNAGSVTKQVFLYATDSTGTSKRSEAEILAGNVFPFVVPQTGPQPAYVYRINVVPPDGKNSEYRITYNRQYSRDTVLQVLGEKQDAVVFTITGETDVRNANGESFAPTFKGYEIYAKDLGLVQSYRDYDGFVFNQRLVERIPMSMLQERAKAAASTSAFSDND